MLEPCTDIQSLLLKDDGEGWNLESVKSLIVSTEGPQAVPPEKTICPENCAFQKTFFLHLVFILEPAPQTINLPVSDNANFSYYSESFREINDF